MCSLFNFDCVQNCIYKLWACQNICVYLCIILFAHTFLLWYYWGASYDCQLISCQRQGESGVHHILLVFVLMLYLCLCNFISQCHCTILALVVWKSALKGSIGAYSCVDICFENTSASSVLFVESVHHYVAVLLHTPKRSLHKCLQVSKLVVMLFFAKVWSLINKVCKHAHVLDLTFLLVAQLK